jgi:hypothetical protein
MQPIQFNGPLLILGSTVITNDSSVSVPAPILVVKDSLAKASVKKDTAKITPNVKKINQVKKNVKAVPKKIKAKSNNKPNNKSLNNVKKSAKAVMPKKV